MEVTLGHNVNLVELTAMIRHMEPTIPFMVYPQKQDVWQHCRYLNYAFAQRNGDLYKSMYYSCHAQRIFTHEELFYRATVMHPYCKDNYILGRKKEHYVEYINKNYMNEDVPFKWDCWDTRICPAILEQRIEVSSMVRYQKKYAWEDEVGKFVYENMENDPWIPYDMEERRKKFPKAFEELKYYIDRIEQDRKKK